MVLAEAEYDRYYTTTGQDSKLLRDARGRHAEAVASLDKANANLELQKDTASALADGLRELAGLGDRAAAAKREAETARLTAEAASQAAGRVTMAQGALAASAERVERLTEALRARQVSDEDISRLSREIDGLRAELTEREAVQKELNDALDRAELRAAEADAALRALRLRADAAQKRTRRLELAAKISSLSDQVEELDRLATEIGTVRAARAELPLIDVKALNRLKALDQAVRTSDAQLQGAAVSVVVHLKESATVEGEARTAGTQVQIDVISNRRIAIGSVAEVEIKPGGGALQALREAKSTAAEALAQALSLWKVRDLDEAVGIHERLAEHDRQLADLDSRLRALSTRSVELLREDQLRVEHELAELGPEEDLAEAGSVSRAELDAAEDAVRIARSETNAASSAASEYREGTATRRAGLDLKQTEQQRLQRQIADRPAAAVLQTQVVAGVSEREQSQVSLADAQRAFEDLGGDEVQADAQRLRVAAEGLQTRVQAAQSTVDQLKGSLRRLMAEGHYETVQQAEGGLAQAKTELDRVERQAAAAKRLWETLSDERRKVVERLTAPVIQRVKPYLQELFPGSTLDAGEALEIAGLQSGNLKEPYEALSGGAQEQLSLLTRIGLAEILADEERLPLILDDVLINTDPERIKRLHRVLFRAADKLQVLLFSCHDVLFDGLGAERVVTLAKAR
jgi:chromosome segregation ATPase